MSLNTAHANGGVLIHSGERILLFCDNVTMEFHGQEQQPEFVGTKQGRLYLTTHRMIFNAKDWKEKMQSFSFPFVTLSDVELNQPIFGANCIKGKCRAQPNGNWVGECKFKLSFKSGGAIEFGQAMLHAASMAQRNGPGNDSPPPYQPPTDWYAAPPPAYESLPTGYYGWMPPKNVFPDNPPANSVYMSDMPPPYPGISTPYQGYASGGNPSQPGFGPPGAAFYGAQMNGPDAQQQSGWGGGYPPQQQQPNGAPGWANPNYNGQPMSQAGAYPSYGQPNYGNYPQNPPPYSTYPQTAPYHQAGPYPQQGQYNPYPPRY